MKTTSCLTFLLAALAASSCTTGERGPGRVAVTSSGNLTVYDAYAPASPAPDVASLYFTVVNAGGAPDTLLTITSPAGEATLHNVVTEDGITRMTPIEALPIPPHGSARLAPGGYHVMFSNLVRPLNLRDTIDVELALASGTVLRFPVPVLSYTEVVERLDQGEPRRR